MKPYWRDEERDLTIWHGDCRDILPTFADGQFGSVITDPPYPEREEHLPLVGKGVAPREQDSVTADYSWDSRLDWLTLVIPQHWAVFTDYQMLGELIVALKRRADVKAVFTWRKPNAPRMLRPIPRLDCEYIVWAKTRGASCERMGEFKSCIMQAPFPPAGCFASERILQARSKKAAHPTQKPVSVMLPFVERLKPPILDPFVGTGTTLVAAAKLGLPATGVDCEERYCEMAAARLSDDVTYGEANLFTLAEASG